MVKAVVRDRCWVNKTTYKLIFVNTEALSRAKKGQRGARAGAQPARPEQVCKPVAGQPVAGQFGGEQRQPAETDQAEAR